MRHVESKILVIPANALAACAASTATGCQGAYSRSVEHCCLLLCGISIASPIKSLQNLCWSMPHANKQIARVSACKPYHAGYMYSCTACNTFLPRSALRPRAEHTALPLAGDCVMSLQGSTVRHPVLAKYVTGFARLQGITWYTDLLLGHNILPPVQDTDRQPWVTPVCRLVIWMTNQKRPGSAPPEFRCG